MYKEHAVFFLYAETPLHPGTGQGLGHIDLPAQREVFSGLPILRASGVKGSIRQHFEDIYGTGYSGIVEAFGPANAVHAGALSFTEAKVLLFPVRSLYGIFAWITCPFVLHRFCRDTAAGATPCPLGNIPSPNNNEVVLIANGSVIAAANKAVFDEYGFTATPCQDTTRIASWFKQQVLPQAAQPGYGYFTDQFPSRFGIVADDVFADFCRLGTEVITRNKISDTTGTVEQGMLWSEEHLPSETVFYAIAHTGDPLSQNPTLTDAREVMRFLTTGATVNKIPKPGLDQQRLFIGGDQTVGKGRVFVRFKS